MSIDQRQAPSGVRSTSTTFAAAIVGETTLPIQCAEILLERGHRVAVVVSADPQVARWAARREVPHLLPSDDLAAALGREPFDYLLSVANLRVLGRELLALPRQGAINFHDGPLPRYAGLNAPAWAILNGEAEHGIAWHRMTERVDAGDLLVQRAVAIAPDDTALTLNLKCYEAGIDAFRELVDRLVDGSLAPTAHVLDQATRHGRDQRPPAACVLRWDRPARELASLVRALTAGDYANPLGTPVARLGDELVAVGRLEVLGRSGAPAGTVTGAGDGSLWVAAADADVALRDLADLDGRPIPVAAAIERHGLTPGARLPLLDGEAATALGELHRSLAPHEGFWTERLAALEPLPAPYERPGRGETGRAAVEVPDAVRERLGADGVLAGVLAYLGRLAGMDRFDVGLATEPLAGPLVPFDGLLATPLPARIEIDPTRRLGAARDAVAAALREARERRGFLRDLRRRTPALHHEAVELPVVVGASEPPAGARLAVSVSSDGGRVTWSGAVTAGDLGRMGRQLVAFLADAAERPVGDAEVLEPAERHRVLVEWNATSREHDREQCVHEAFEAQVDRTPEATALVVGEERLTYAELDRRANRLAHHLRARGVGPGERVGVHVERSVELVVGLLGVLKAGAAYVPMDPGFPSRRIEQMVEDARPAAVLRRGELWGSLSSGPEERLSSGVTAEDLAYVMYTSGSTGKPKGVRVRHRNVVSFFAGMDERLVLEPAGVWLAVTSISFDISVLELFWTLARGFQVVLLTDQEPEAVAPAAGSPAVPSVATPEFSLFYFGAGEGPSPDDRYRLLLEGARFADEHGFAAVWTPERHFHAFGGLYPNPAVVGAALATMTRRVGIRAGSCVSPLHSVIRIAEEWAVVDNLSGGRVGVSFASGWQPDDFVLAPANFADRKALMGRQIDMARRLWRGDSIWAPGPLGRDVQVSTLPRPIQPELPVWITSAGSPDTFRVAGEMGCNVLTHLLGQSVAEVAEKVRAYREAWRDAGRGPGSGHVTLMLHSFVGEDDAEVKERVRAPMKEYLRSSVGLIQRAAWSFPAFKRATTDAEGRFALDHLSPEDLDSVLDFSFERYYETSGLLGSPDKCLRLIDELREIGIDEIACLIDFVDDTELVLEHLPMLNAVREAASRRAAPDAAPDARHPVARLIEERGVTHLQCTPSMASMLLASPGCREAMGGLRQLLIGGEAFPAGLARELRESVGGSIVNVYGPTETTIWSTTHELGGEEREGSVPIGRPIANTRCYVLDGELRPVPVGVSGELYVGGEGVTAGYWEREELTGERFVEDPFGMGEGRLYRTGDLARYREDGVLEYQGRGDQQVKLRGYRIELGEVESVLSLHPGVREAAVVVREERLVAYVVAEGEARPGALELREWLGERLPEYMVPAAYESLEEMPRTPNAKIDRRALPEPRGHAASERFLAPRDELEQALADIWERELRVRPIGVQDDFFQLGGHSLVAVQVFNQIERTLGERLPLATLLRAPTIEQLASVLRAMAG
jgi:natural product biosynthesis luciferase-like monooxygenase protein